MSDAATPPDPNVPAASLKDRLAAVARQGPPKSRARLWVWVVFGGAALVAGLLQVFGVTSSPVADKVLRERQARERQQAPRPGAPEAPAPAGPSPSR